MSKDPAFLFYSQSFYESTRMMFPEERACYIDLLIYQHQNGNIPLDIRRIYLYCTGVSNEVVNQVLNQKFNKTDDGWYNKKMEGVINERKVGNPKKRAYATLAGLLSANDIEEKTRIFIKKEFNVDDFVNLEPTKMKDEIKVWFYSLVNVFVNNNKDKDKDKSIIKNIDTTKKYSSESKNCLNECLIHFESHLHPTGKNLENWLDTIEKLERIDKIPFEKIIEIVRWARNDDFWRGVFLSIPKLRTNNKEGVKYIVAFNEKKKQQNANRNNSNNSRNTASVQGTFNAIDKMYGDQ